MTDFRKGDKVRVAYETVIKDVQPGYVRVRTPLFDGSAFVSPANLERIERVKTSADDPIGTVRRFKSDSNHAGTIIVRTVQKHGYWSMIGTELGSDLDGWGIDAENGANSYVDEATEIIGYVPGFEPEVTPGRVLEDCDGDRWWELSPGKFTLGNDFAETKDVQGDCYRDQSESEVNRRYGPVKDVSHLFKDSWK